MRCSAAWQVDVFGTVGPLGFTMTGCRTLSCTLFAAASDPRILPGGESARGDLSFRDDDWVKSHMGGSPPQKEDFS